MLLMTWWRNFCHRDRIDAEIDSEMRAVHDLLVDEKIGSGMNEPAARRAAAIEFGGIEQVKERVRDARLGSFLGHIQRDAIYGLRMMRREALFTAVGIATLALGIGLHTMMFTQLNGLVLRGLPIEQPDRVLNVSTRDAGGRNGGLSNREYQELRDHASNLAALAAYAPAAVTIGDDHEAPERANAAYVSASAFGILRQPPMLGRDFRATDDVPGAPPVVILGRALWASQFASDPRAVGGATRVNGVVTTVIGVMPDRFGFPATAELWLPLSSRPSRALPNREADDLNVMGRIRDTATQAQAIGQVAAITAQFAHEPSRSAAPIRFLVVPINSRYNNGGITNPAWLAFAVVSVLIVIVACATVANLLLARSTARTHEVATRVSLGATRSRIVRQLLVEGALTAIAGASAGLLVSLAGIKMFTSWMPRDLLPYWVDFSPDWHVFGALVAVTTGAVFAFALTPALHVVRVEVQDVLRDSNRQFTQGRRARRWTSAFLVLELALTLALMTSVVLGVQKFVEDEKAEVLAATDAYVTAWVQLPPDRYATNEARAKFYQQLQQRLDAERLTSEATTASTLPSGGGAARRLEVAGRALDVRTATIAEVAIDPRYFEVIGAPLRAGRSLMAEDGTVGHQAAIVNERVAQLYFPNKNPIGESIRLTNDRSSAQSDWMTIVGIAPPIRQNSSGAAVDGSVIDPVVYVPYNAFAPASAVLIVHASNNAVAVTTALRAELHAVDPNVPIYDVMTMAQAIRRYRWAGTFSVVLIFIIGAVVLTMAVVGLFTVTLHAVNQRRQEIGLRRALGASSGHLVWLVLRRAIVQLVLGLFGGVLLSALWTHIVPSSSPGVDPAIVVLAVLVVSLVSLAACVWPARRAARLDPMQSLRFD